MRNWVGGALGVLVVLLIVSGAEACTCMKRSVAEIVCDSQVVFEGEATKTTMIGADQRVMTTFRVTTNWKDADKPKIKVIHSALPSMCGVSFEDRSNYLVFAYRSENLLTTGLCSLTKADPESVRPALQVVRGRSFKNAAECVAAVDKALNTTP